MATEAMITRRFWMVDDRLGLVKKRPDARLYESEVVTIGLLFVARGGQYRPFSRWLTAKWLFVSGAARPDAAAAPVALVERVDGRVLYHAIVLARGGHLRHRMAPSATRRAKLAAGQQKGVSNGCWMIGVKVG